MGFARRVLLVVLTVAVGAYASDCGGMTTPEQAMRCCNSMQCSSHAHHGQECCKTMPAIHAALGQPSSVQSLSFSPLTFTLVQALNDPQSIESAARMIAEYSHAPPASCSPAALPLRI